VLGAGGHAKVLVDTLQACILPIMGIVDSDPPMFGTRLLNVPVLGNDDVIEKFSPTEIKLVMGIGSVGLPHKREELYKKYKLRGYCFATVIHPSAVIASDVVIGEGCQVMAGAVIQPGCHIGVNCIVNTSTSVDHDCVIGDHVHIAPGVTLSGGVSISNGVHIGTGATIIQGIKVGSCSIIAAGAVVVNNVADRETVIGIPAKVLTI
jgi:UDP-perosamine 4-acetyltransferase